MPLKLVGVGQERGSVVLGAGLVPGLGRTCGGKAGRVFTLDAREEDGNIDLTRFNARYLCRQPKKMHVCVLKKVIVSLCVNDMQREKGNISWTI